MFKKLKLKLASRRVNNRNAKKAPKKISKPKTVKGGFFSRLFQWIKSLPARLWNWIKSIDIVGLANIALLSVIIVMFTILLMNIFGLRKCNNLEYSAPEITTGSKQAASIKSRNVVARVSVDTNTMNATITLPLKQVVEPKPANTVPAPRVPNETVVKIKSETVVIKPAAATPIRNRVVGDVIIDGRYKGDQRPESGDIIEGDLIIQDMYRFTLPQNITINGNLIVRNIGLLRFGKKLNVSGNIYVGSNSSFGPIPRDANIGGEVIF